MKYRIIVEEIIANEKYDLGGEVYSQVVDELDLTSFVRKINESKKELREPVKDIEAPDVVTLRVAE